MNGKVQSTIFSDLKGLASSSLIYGVGSILIRSLNLIVLPLYTRHLSLEEYGLVAVVTTLGALLNLLLPLSLYSAIPRFYFEAKTEEERRRLIGTIWVAMIGFGFALAIFFELVGESVFKVLFPELSYEPYGRFAIWTSFFTLFSFTPLNIYQVREQPHNFVLWSGANLVCTVGLVLLFVVGFGQGAHGYLLGAFLASGLVAIPYALITLKLVDPAVNLKNLRKMLKYSVPLIPHGLASWGLTLADRTILQLFVPLSSIGLYSLGYQLGSIMVMVSGAMANAWIPYFFKQVADHGGGANARLSKLVTYYVLATTVVAMLLCLFAKEVVLVLTADVYHAAWQLVPIVVIGYFFNSLYFISSQFLLAKLKSHLLPITTVIAALFNLVLNFSFIPSYGIEAAAWSMLASFLIMFSLVFLAANKYFPFPYEYGRIFRVMLAGGVVIGLGYLAGNFSLGIGFICKLGLLIFFPILLFNFGFFSKDEKDMLQRLIGR